MYICIVHFGNDEQKNEALHLLDTRLIHSRSILHDCVHLRTRKLWKFFWFSYRFRKFSKNFSYSEFSSPCRSIVLPEFISKKKFSHNVELVDAYTQKISIHFSNIHDIWKIRLSMFLKN